VRVLRFLVAAVVAVALALLAMYGTLLVVYSGEGKRGSSTYITVMGRRMDAHVAGALSLVVVAVLVGTWLVARRRSAEPR